MTIQIDDDRCTVKTEAPVAPVAFKRRLRVKISLAFNEIFPVANRASMGAEDVRATWYSKSEYNAMKSEIIPVLRKMMKGEVVHESNKETTRGLEYRTRKGATLRQQNRLNGIAAVLAEQKRQRVTGIAMIKRQPELISQVYLAAAALQCQEVAHQTAIADAVEVKDYCKKFPFSSFFKAKAEVKKMTPHFRVRSPMPLAPGKSAAVAA